jgi:glycosyltransferase involved in cell wall biosynthesis
MHFFRKGTDLVVRAFQQVTGDAKLIIHTQKPLRAQDLGLDAPGSSRIQIITGTVPAPGLYHLGDVYVYPSRLEGIGLTICEALACGLPVITTDNPPMNEFVDHGENGLLVKVADQKRREDSYYWPMATVDIQDLRSKMQWYVDHPNSVSSHSQQARQSAEVRFSWEKNSRILGDFVEGLQTTGAKRKPGIRMRTAWLAHSLCLAAYARTRGATRTLRETHPLLQKAARTMKRILGIRR